MLLPMRASRLLLVRIARHQVALQHRTFHAPTAMLRADFVQELYLKELKGYKPAPLRPSDADDHVPKFSPPRAPQSPEESDIANGLKAYEEQQVEVEGQAAGGAPAVEEDWFEEEEEEAEASH